MESMVWHSGLASFVPVPAFVEQEIMRAAARFPGRTALCEAGGRRSITFGQLADGSSRLAGGLAELGVGRGDVVSIVAANHPDFGVALYGSLTAGAAVATANPSLTASELRRLLLLSRPKVVLADTHSISAVTEALASLGSDARVFMLDGPAGAQPVSALLRSPSPGRAQRDPGDCALLFPSSGTTAFPKIAVHTHAGATAWLQAFARTPSICMHATDVVAVVAPFTHMFGSAVATHALRAGATVVASRTPGFTLETFVRMLADHRVTVASATPPVALALARHPLVEEFDLSALRLVILGAAPTSRDVQVELADRLGCQVADCLGSTEAFCYAPAADPIVRGSVGTLGPNMSAVVVDPDSGERVGPDESGELWIRGPQVMAGYLSDQQETAQVLDPDGWLRTGDLCSIDADGNIYIHDRLKELIKVGGASVAPAEVEQELMAHPAVIDAAVVGRPHPELGEVPVAYVSLHECGDARELLRGFFDDRLALWKHPRDVVVIDSVPRSANGKLMRRELIAREEEAHGPVVAA